MDLIRFGLDVRLLRRRKGWSQARLASEVGRSRWVVSEIECGRGSRFGLDLLARIVAGLGGFLTVRISFKGEGLDRLRDREHARLVEVMVGLLTAAGWEVATEATFNVYGDRGSVDILAFHARTGALLVIEVKTTVPDVGGMLATLDKKRRNAGTVAQERGWEAATTSTILVFSESSTTRRRVRDHATTFLTAFPARNDEVRRWLRDPTGTLNGILFQSVAGPSGNRLGKPATDPSSNTSHARLVT